MTKKNVETDDVTRRPKRYIWTILFILIISVTTGCLFAPTFNIIAVEAEDGNNITSGEIIERANIKIGENIFRINDSKIKKSIESIPYAKKAKIYRALPNKIILKVEERVPYTIVKYLESYATIDKYGYILDVQSENNRKDLPIIYGINPDECISGEKLSGISMLKYENSVYILESAKKIDFPYSFSEINYDDSTNVKLYIKEKDIDIIYGEIVQDTIEEKIGHLASILLQLGDKKGKIDMSNEDYLARTVFTERK